MPTNELFKLARKVIDYAQKLGFTKNNLPTIDLIEYENKVTYNDIQDVLESHEVGDQIVLTVAISIADFKLEVIESELDEEDEDYEGEKDFKQIDL